jgi:hypothetical protein
VQKVTAILFSVLILFQNLNVNTEDFTKLKVLVEHAQFHYETYGDSLFDFLIEHYGDADHHEMVEHKEHDDLPFKHSQQNCSQLPSLFLLIQFNFTIPQQVFNETRLNVCYKEPHSIFEKISVFQPPKAA